jgi:hypothetical protein
MLKGAVDTTKKWHDKHSQQLKQRKLRNLQIKIDRRNYNPQRLAERHYRKQRAEMERYWANLKWYQRVWIKIKYWFKK